MKMNIKPAALDYIKSKMGDKPYLMLALDDGSNNYSKVGGTCTIGTKFQFVVIDKLDPNYNIKIENNGDLPLTTSEPETVFLGKDLVIDYKMGILKLSNETGMIDGAVTISQYEAPTEDKAKLAKEMQTMGTKIC